MAGAAIETLLKGAIGLEAGSIGRGSVARAVKRRMNELAMTDGAAYSLLLQGSREEQRALVEEVVVPESWFFRNHEAFRVLQSFVADEWRPAHPGGVVRVLSLPCSSGEEPYSIAMALMDAGLKPGEFEVDAVDVSRRALARAELALYGKNSFRGVSRALCGHHFKETKTGFALHESVRKTVRFHHGNVLDLDFMNGLGTYDVIFCRNLLIYFDAEGRTRTARLVAGMLAADGMLFVGHAEGGLMWEGLLTSARYPMAFAYRKFNDDRRVMDPRVKDPPQKPKPAARRPKPNERRWLRPTERRGALAARYRKEDAASGKAEASAPPAPPAPDRAQSLETAYELAGGGRLEEAAALCEACLRDSGPSAQAYFILGLIKGTQNDKAAANDCFRKALYLEPDHYEALVHLALLMEEQGDSAAARRLKRRTRRVYEKGLAGGGKANDGKD